MIKQLSFFSSFLMLCICQTTFSQLPSGYTVIYDKDFQTTQKAADYLGGDVWWFYWGGSGATNNDHPELDKRFIIGTDPAGGVNKALRMIKFDGDEDYANQNLNPRTELSYRPSMERSASKEIYFRLKTFFPSSQASVFSAEFIQWWLHGSSNIPLQLEVRDGMIKARRPDKGRVNISKSPALSDNVDRWITWEIRAKFNQSSGYWRIYKDGDLVFDQAANTNWPTSDWPSNSGTWHPQHGIYTNNGGDGTMTAYFDDLLIAEYTGVTNQQPSVSITAPANNSTYTVPASITITADASDPDGSISKVEFFNGSTKLGEKTSSPFSYTWNNVPEGTYTITAEATDNQAASATSSPITVIVSDPPSDCNGVVDGSAYYDDCGICVEGNTGLLPNDNCNADCGNPVIVSASGHDGNTPENTLDGNSSTRWSTDSVEAWIIYAFPCPRNLSQINIAFSKGDERSTIFDMAISTDSSQWEEIFNGQSSGTSLGLESFDVSGEKVANFVKIRGYGNTSSEWTSITQIQFTYTLEADCNGTNGGTAFVDNCGVCAGGKTGIVPNESCQTYSNAAKIHNSSFYNLRSNNKAISFNLPKAQTVSISLFSFDGKKLEILQSSKLEAGSHNIPLKKGTISSAIICRVNFEQGIEKWIKVFLN